MILASLDDLQSWTFYNFFNTVLVYVLVGKTVLSSVLLNKVLLNKLANKLALQFLNTLRVFIILLLQLRNLVGVVLNNIELLLNIKLLLLLFYLRHHLIVFECQHLLLEHLNFVA